MLSTSTKMLSRVAATRQVATFSAVRSMSAVISLSDNEAVEKFAKVNSKSILYFTATWCPPCRQIKPIYEEMAKTTEGIAFGKIDVDENADAAQEYEISAVPTFIGLKNEQVLARFSGADKSQIEAMVAKLNS